MSQAAHRLDETLARVGTEEGVAESMRGDGTAPSREPAGDAGSVSVTTLKLQPLNTNVSLREQAYAALKAAIMDADIFAHREEIRLD
jgi:hypothetical protein